MFGNRIVKWFRKNNIQILIWILYMLYETLVLGILFNQPKALEIYVVHYLVTILFFYLHSNYALPWATKFGVRYYWLVPPVIILQLIACIYAHYLATVFLLLTGDYETIVYPTIDKAFIFRNLYRAILMMGYATGYFFLRRYLVEKKKTEELEKERLEKIIEQQQIERELVNAQNAFLKAQINPHFLFNTLDFVYHKVNAKSEIAGEAVIRLAEMMRFAIDSDEMGTTILVGKEIEQVENLLFLYQIRKTADLNVHLTYQEEVKQLRLIPLVLLTLVENIFKHGDISNPDEIAIIDLDVDNGHLHIQTKNLIKKNKVADSYHSGLNNICKRLSYAYGEQVEFQYQTIDIYFKVDIVIPLQLLKQLS